MDNSLPTHARPKMSRIWSVQRANADQPVVDSCDGATHGHEQSDDASCDYDFIHQQTTYIHISLQN